MNKKKTLSIFIVLLILSVVITGCGSNTKKEENNNNDELNVYTSFYPVYDFTSKIAGDKVLVHNMIPVGIEAHGWEPTASDIVKLEEADMFVYNGLGMEHWVDDVLESIENEDLIRVEASQGIKLLKYEIDEDDFGENDNNYDHGKFDPHVWTHPLNVKIEMENIKNGLIELDPDNKEYYKENYEKYSKELDKLNKEFSETISDLPNKDIVVSHKSFTYMSNAYNLNQIPISGLSPDVEPNPDRMTEIIKFVEENNVKVIFFEELTSPKIANVIADATGCKVDVLNPLEGLSDRELENGDDYFSIMRNNLKSLKNALR